METIRRQPFGQKRGAASCLVISIIFILLVAAGIFTLQSYLATRDPLPEPVSEKPSFHFKQVRPGWWETTNYIYFDIPARVVFQLPEKEERIDPEVLSKQIWNEFERIGNIFNPFDPDSETARLNRAGTRRTIPVSKEMLEVLMLSRTLWLASNGAFDPTMLPVKQMWEDAVQSQQIPSNREITKAMAHAGFDKVEIIKERSEIRRKDKGVRFDFGGIAKGFAVDKVTALLREHEIPAALVALSGEIRTFGKNDDTPWRIGLQHPLDMNALWGVVSSDLDICVSTSGNYRQPLFISGREFYHIFDPQTGRPVSEKILGVTTLCSSKKASNALLDGTATAITVTGMDEGIKLAERLGIETLIVKKSRTGEIEEAMTAGFKTHYEPAQ